MEGNYIYRISIKLVEQEVDLTEKEELLKLETRRRIYNFILKYPGLHLRKICRELWANLFGII